MHMDVQLSVFHFHTVPGILSVALRDIGMLAFLETTFRTDIDNILQIQLCSEI